MVLCVSQRLLHDEKIQVVGRLNKRHSGSPGGRLQSKPTWLNAFWVFNHVGFFSLLAKTDFEMDIRHCPDREKEIHYGCDSCHTETNWHVRCAFQE